MKKLFLIPILGLMLATVGCTPLERVVYNTVVASKAFLNKESANHPECTNADASTYCGFLAKAYASQHVLVDAGEEYCASDDFENGGACTPPMKGTPAYVQAEAKLKAALANYDRDEADLKGVL